MVWIARAAFGPSSVPAASMRAQPRIALSGVRNSCESARKKFIFRAIGLLRRLASRLFSREQPPSFVLGLARSPTRAAATAPADQGSAIASADSRRAGLHHLGRQLLIALSGQRDERRRQAEHPGALEQLEAVALRQAIVEEDAVDRLALEHASAASASSTSRMIASIASGLQGPLHRGPIDESSSTSSRVTAIKAARPASSIC